MRGKSLEDDRFSTVFGVSFALSYVCHRFPIGSLQGAGRRKAMGGVRRAAASTVGGVRTESWSYKMGTDRREPKVFRAHAPPHGVCDNLINALELLANQYQDGDSPVRVLVDGHQERSRLKMMEVSCESASRWTTTKPSGSGESAGIAPGREAQVYRRRLFAAVEWEGADELTLPREEESMLRTFVETTNVGDCRWGLPLVDEDWHAICESASVAVRAAFGARLGQLPSRSGATCTSHLPGRLAHVGQGHLFCQDDRQQMSRKHPLRLYH